MAGEQITQVQVDREIASRVKQLNRMGFELRKIKETLDRLDTAGLLALSSSGRFEPWTETDVATLRGAVDALVGYFDGFDGPSKSVLDSLAGFGY